MVLAMLVGLVEVTLAVVGLGEAISRILSAPVTKGYCSACAFYIATSQIKNLLEITVRSTHSPLNLFGAWYDMFDRIDKTNKYSVIFGFAAMAIMLSSKFLIPRAPCELAVVVLAILLTWGLDLTDKMKIVGHIDDGLPGFHFPKLDKWGVDLFGRAILIAILTYIISISIVKNFAMKHSYPVRGNGHLLALGAANIFGSMFTCYPASGSLSLSFVLEASDGQTTMSSLVPIVLLILTLLFFTSLFKDLPKAVLAAIIFVALKNLFKRLNEGYLLWRRNQRADSIVWFATFCGTLVLGMQLGICVGMGSSAFILLFMLHRHGAVKRTASGVAEEARAAIKESCSPFSCAAKEPEPYQVTLLGSGDLEGVTKTPLGSSAPGVCMITFSFGLPLCFLNMDSYRARLLAALEAARADALASAPRLVDGKLPSAAAGSAAARAVEEGEYNALPADEDEEEEKKPQFPKTILLLDFAGIDFIDSSAFDMLARLVAELSSRSECIHPYIVSASPEMVQQMEGNKIKANIGDEFFIDSHTGAVAHAQQTIVAAVEQHVSSAPRVRAALRRQGTYNYYLASPTRKGQGQHTDTEPAV